MRSVSTVSKTGSHRPSGVTPAAPGAWNNQLALEVEASRATWTHTTCVLLDDYLRGIAPDGEEEQLSNVISACMAEHAVEVLKTLLKQVHIESLCINGPMDERGWQTLIDAMPDAFPVQALTLLELHFCRSAMASLFQALDRMKPKSLALQDVGTESDIDFERLACPELKLENLDVIAAPSVNFCPLLLQLLKSCEIQQLHIEDAGATRPDLFASLSKALEEQTKLKSLDLERTPLAARDFNMLLKAAPKETMRRISFRDCGLKDSEAEPIDFSPIAEMHSLWRLDLGRNSLSDEAKISLLRTLANCNTSLEELILSGSRVGVEVFSAMASLLVANGTLRRLSCGGWPWGLKLLTDALEQNTSLLSLDMRAVPGADRLRINEFLHRNREAFMAVAMERAGHVVRKIGLETTSAHNVPLELGRKILDQGLTWQDVLSLSSVNMGSRYGLPL